MALSIGIAAIMPRAGYANGYGRSTATDLGSMD